MNRDRRDLRPLIALLVGDGHRRDDRARAARAGELDLPLQVPRFRAGDLLAFAAR
jgi:hypothetical protein